MGNMPEIWFPHLGIKIEHLSRVIFQIFGYDVYWYGVIIGSGVLVALALAIHEAKRTQQNPENYIDIALFGVIFSVIGARLYYVIFSWEFYASQPLKIFALREGGLAIYGGIIAGIITVIVYTKIKKLNFWLVADTAAPSLLLGQIIGRWGNFFNREAFGGYTNNIFAMRYLKEQVHNVSASVLEKVVTINGTEYIQVHPTFLYESMWNMCVFVLLFIMKKRKKFNGEIFGLYLLGYACGRVWIEALRTDQLKIANFAVSQLLSALLIVGAIVLLWYRGKSSKVV
ncbi:prolipoprotein diacylglyceryl transferase [Clostridium sp. MD294]|uniref:prolipoprotein diacylglyceryl transferase n=1 Tax=Clostridium sp. MD294 TaxID=97138 RepID=UPI0002CBB2E7|nr:prolipoprotein diacylglyceryl transferase [Clostridium sp. MD294]NDO46906.1 prolipoprotein diacylglyceryl transferase [Clostridium sp. MD294]USF28651.1 Phosphatidylglycerol--prolipoprotein diacylglyceryl transferase [Clostridium sp. MD294]